MAVINVSIETVFEGLLHPRCKHKQVKYSLYGIISLEEVKKMSLIKSEKSKKEKKPQTPIKELIALLIFLMNHWIRKILIP